MNSPYIRQLDDRIRALKADALAHKSWMQLRREIESHGGRWEAPNGIVFELHDGAIYQHLSDHGEGVSQLVTTSLDAEVPYVAELSLDMQGVPPEKRSQLLKELAQAQLHKAQAGAPPAAAEPKVELVTIVEGDWLSKITQKRWGTFDWKLHLQPTALTLASRKARGRDFHEDLIYPGDTFEVRT